LHAVAASFASCWFLAVCATYAANAQPHNPFEGDAAAIQAGRVLYAVRCSDCHGADAKGARGPDLTALWTVDSNDSRVFQTIRLGVAGSIMPPSFAPDTELWAMIAYLRSVSTVPPFEIVGADIEHGRQLFGSHCSDCHRVRDDGGHLGPELTRIAQARSREALVQAIRDPDASIPLGYRTVSVRTRRDERVRGVVKTEDAFSMQIVDATGRLRGYRKADLEELTREPESLMPRFSSDRLSERELDDLVAFLGTLRDASSDEVP
jgi:cytochrome c oxidase cbb3-type subunit III